MHIQHLSQRDALDVGTRCGREKINMNRYSLLGAIEFEGRR